MTDSDKIIQLRAQYLAQNLSFNDSIVDSVNHVLEKQELQAWVSVNDTIVVGKHEDDVDLAEYVVYYDVYNQRACLKLIVHSDNETRVLLDMYLSVTQMVMYHELVSTMQLMALFTHIESLT